MRNDLIIKDINDIKKLGRKYIDEENTNAYSNIFINNDTVYKIYKDNKIMVKQNLIIIKKLLKLKQKQKIDDRVVLPNGLVKYNNTVIGFSMPFIKGLTLEQYLKKYNATKVLNDIYDLIFYLDSIGINIGDLHEKNFIIDQNENIHLIDCDSFIIKNKNIYDEFKNLYKGKYLTCYDTYGVAVNGINFCTDLFCLFTIILNRILLNNNFNYTDIIYNRITTNDSILNNLLNKKDKMNFYMTKYELNYLIENINTIKFTKINLMDDYEALEEINSLLSEL